ncbi:MAG TPA: VWA domain-containing protein [Pyrinomonadaceae bacterium]|nr:VWA domain-containing protein [Pyrinomonadaceae bacterium]
MKHRLVNQYQISLILLTALSLTSLAQEVPGPPSQSDKPLRELHVIITDSKAHSLDDVKQNDIQVIEDGLPQTIESFSVEERPVIYGLVIDTSGSMRTQLPKIIDTAKKIIETNRPNDEAFIVSFVTSTRILLLQETTSDKLQMLNALNKLFIEGGQTAVIDAVYLSAQKLLKTEPSDQKLKPRKALILITDGEDRSSAYKEEQLLSMLQNSELKIFAIGLVEELDSTEAFIRRSPRERAVRLIERFTKETGGRAFFPRNKEDFTKVADEITHDLQRQYVVGYRSTAGAQKFHTVEIKVSDTPDKKKRRGFVQPKYKAQELEPVVNKKP